MNVLPLNGYCDAIHLNKPFNRPQVNTLDKQWLTDILYEYLFDLLKCEEIAQNEKWLRLNKRQSIDAIITILEPNVLSGFITETIGQLLELEKIERQITHADTLAQAPFLSIGDTKLILWKGDITTLECDAIVNAANNQLLGCFKPFHNCIDNAIHNRAGVQLRADCNTIIRLQGNPEPTGQAKVTRAYHLPSRYVIHSVGAIATHHVSPRDKWHLTNCYNSILSLATQKADIKTLAFCSISTGVFGFPIEQAAPIAIDTVTRYLDEHQNIFKVIVFNVFNGHDYLIYQAALEDYVCHH
ncbi:protein-ADP-ribose hydrolase [Dickeya zeae]|uniref:Protein-ADP-ribose hydrolase n=1 Tax=Dickeya zeae TaxID=204042 RepID=A0AAE7CYP2_9GAMM|nr:protein-ADP-ribose hydrolase [Dickeya zeae]QIZ50510.1 protein-ADP-ribose hydrolase [Dickeya zeae]